MKKEELFEITKVSSKGQLVLPKNIRRELNIKKGTLFALTRRGTLVMLKKIEKPILKKDLITLKNVEKAWKEIESGKFKRAGREDFLKELAKW
jgi:AbrB family looped-hinge helix DNA binding protein